VVASDTTLALIWQQHRQAIERAKAAAGLAAPLEQSATGQRAEAKHQREEADRLIAEAADLEAAANQADHDARGHRQDEDFHAATARELAENVAFLVATNRRMHPEEKAQRDADNAAKNAAAAAHPLTAPVGLDHQIPPANPDTTAPFAAAGEQM
jgi:hypothetical protein